MGQVVTFLTSPLQVQQPGTGGYTNPTNPSVLKFSLWITGLACAADVAAQILEVIGAELELKLLGGTVPWCQVFGCLRPFRLSGNAHAHTSSASRQIETIRILFTAILWSFIVGRGSVPAAGLGWANCDCFPNLCPMPRACTKGFDRRTVESHIPTPSPLVRARPTSPLVRATPKNNERCCVRNLWHLGMWCFLFWWSVKIKFFL